MEGLGYGGQHTTAITTNLQTSKDYPLHTYKTLPQTPFHRVFGVVYACAIAALFFHHAQTLLYYSTTSLTSFSATLILFLADLVLAFMWSSAQALRTNPIARKEYPENLEKIVKRNDFPGLDVFICTANPYKEPPMSVVSTALSVLSYDYPTEKLSVYVSDDGGSALTLFAFMEAAKFAAHWLPFCRHNNIVQRSPDVYFRSSYPSSSETQNIKMMYESMKERVEGAVESGNVGDEYINSDEEREIFSQYRSQKFTRQSHPSVIQVLLENGRDRDITGHFMPNLIYVSREKSKSVHHNFKAGALNALIRVSTIMTNAPIILTLDCDMYSNDPQTPLRVLCYYTDPKICSEYAYIQFPQHFHGTNKNDTYAVEFKLLFLIQSMGHDGLNGPNHVGTGCFFNRRAFFGSPSSMIPQQIPELSPHNVVNEPIRSQHVLNLVHKVAGCHFDKQTGWGSEVGYRYGSVVEDLFTGYRLQREGWKSIYCNPSRAAFLGDAPINLLDLLIQQKRWAYGVLEIGFSKYTPLIYGIKRIGFLKSLAYSQYAFWSIMFFPINVYAFLPQLALLNNFSIFPKVSEPWFILYVFLFLGAYGQDYLNFALVGGSFQKWWNDQRIWLLRGVTSHTFGVVEFILKSFGISTQGFNVTSKVVDNEQCKRYMRGIFEFGVHSPMFVPLVMVAFINLSSLVGGLCTAILKGRHNVEGLIMQMLIAGYAVLNCWPIYGAVFWRKDKGKMPAKTTAYATFMSIALFVGARFIFN